MVSSYGVCSDYRGGNGVNKYYEGVKMLFFPTYNDGGYIEVEGLKDVPFEIKRIFYIFGKGNVGTVRGKHSNRKSEFVLFNVKGKSKIKTIDENKKEIIYELNEPNQAVYLPKMVWKEMYDFTEDSVLMVLTNEYYDATEYIREFEEFVMEIKAEEYEHES